MKIPLIKIPNTLIPFPGYGAMTVLIFVFIQKKFLVRFTPRVENHERIHIYQQVEIFGSSILIGLITCIFSSLSWWWMFATPVIPLLLYILCWIIELLLPPFDSTYKNVCFESEAIYNEHDSQYCKTRTPFSWIKYIPNKKYPYISVNNRPKYS